MQDIEQSGSKSFVESVSTWATSESYWVPSHLVDSAWLEHGSFGFWIVQAMRPRVIVELGTHSGFSYFVFCEAVKRLALSTRCFGLDTWVGDEHAGFYGEQVFELVSGVNADLYASFSTLLRGYFNDSLCSFEDGTIDLLHIDGRHGYDDVKDDFHSWLPKLSSRAVVLFHDIAEHENGFGVWKLWEELSLLYPSFSFTNGHGLGVITVGPDIPEGVRDLFAADAELVQRIRGFYGSLGGRIYGLYALLAERARLEEAVRLTTQRMEQAQSELSRVLESTAWRVTGPIRCAVGLVPEWFRRLLRLQ